ncbi:hypothetical protein EJ06DRAFT_531972, partial [Trichodelitschia bisporula]
MPPLTSTPLVQQPAQSSPRCSHSVHLPAYPPLATATPSPSLHRHSQSPRNLHKHSRNNPRASTIAHTPGRTTVIFLARIQIPIPQSICHSGRYAMRPRVFAMDFATPRPACRDKRSQPSTLQ